MRVLNAKVNWYKQYANDAKLMVLVDKIPSLNEAIYDHVAVADGVAYCTSEEGFVHYLFHAPKNQTGYGGSLFKLATKNGEVELIGPWSSRSGCMNALFPQHQSIEVHITDREKEFDSGCFLSGCISVELAREALKLIHPELKLYTLLDVEETNYFISKDDAAKLGL